MRGDPELIRRAEATRERELATIRTADVTLVVSGFEREILREQVPEADVRILSNVVTLAPAGPGFAARRDMFFVGGFRHAPNVDAMCWYVEAV